MLPVGPAVEPAAGRRERTTNPFWIVAAATCLIAAGVGLMLGYLAVRLPGSPAAYYRQYFRDQRRERLFLASLGFFVAFGTVRGITHAIRDQVGPFRDLAVGGTHVHHLVWGILLLLAVGYCWLVQVGTGADGSSPRTSKLTAALYGIGAALTLDEFALWLRLEDVYWTREGRESIDAVVLFGAALSVGLWGRPFFRAVARALGREARRALRD
ncbi:MAG TPA: hypothetical protein VF406_16460 [Thermodesulfobacteriota bacterium]